MQKLMVDQWLRDQLRKLGGPVELCDEEGQTLGHFLPAGSGQGLVRETDQCPYTEEELARFRQETGGRTLAAIWKSLGRT